MYRFYMIYVTCHVSFSMLLASLNPPSSTHCHLPLTRDLIASLRPKAAKVGLSSLEKIPVAPVVKMRTPSTVEPVKSWSPAKSSYSFITNLDILLLLKYFWFFCYYFTTKHLFGFILRRIPCGFSIPSFWAPPLGRSAVQCSGRTRKSYP